MQDSLRDKTLEVLVSDKFPVWFIDWIDTNWDIWENFEKMSRQMANTGRSHYSARVITEVMRWESDLEDSSGSFKINNNHTPYMARLFMKVHPQYDKFFRTRQ